MVKFKFTKMERKSDLQRHQKQKILISGLNTFINKQNETDTRTI